MRNPLWAPEYTGRIPSFNDMGSFRLNRNHPINQGLIGWWLCNEGAGKVLYDLVGHNFAAFSSGTTRTGWGNTVLGNGVVWDAGTDDYATLGDFRSRYTNQFSCLVTLVFSAVDTTIGIFGQMDTANNYDWMMYIASDGSVNFYVKTFQTKSANGPVLSAGVVYNAVGVYNGANVNIYVNGVKSTSVAQTENVLANQTSTILGRGYNNQAMRATVHSASIWDRGLSRQEALELSRGYLFGTPDNPRFLVQPRRKWFVPVVGGGTAYTQSLDATWTGFASGLPKQVGKTFNAT